MLTNHTALTPKQYSSQENLDPPSLPPSLHPYLPPSHSNSPPSLPKPRVLFLGRSFDKQLEGARQAEAAAARALAEQVSSKNPLALWLDSFLGTPVAKSGTAAATSGGSVAPVTATAGATAGAGAGAPASAVADSGDGTSRSYFDNSVAAYAVGLGLCFAVNFFSRSGQPGGCGSGALSVAGPPRSCLLHTQPSPTLRRYIL